MSIDKADVDRQSRAIVLSNDRRHDIIHLPENFWIFAWWREFEALHQDGYNDLYSDLSKLFL